MLAKIRRFLNKRFQYFATKRIGSSTSFTLGQRNVFVFPSTSALPFVSVLIVLWLLGTNYQNNLILALVFLMAALLVFAILSAFNNMRGLKLHYLGQKEAFAGDRVYLRFSLEHQRAKALDAIEFAWRGQLENSLVIDLQPGETKEFELAFHCTQRGVYQLPKMRVQSVFPLGIIRCWTWLTWSGQLYVYPKPQDGDVDYHGYSEHQGEQTGGQSGSEDFSGLRAFRPGDAIARIHWKSLAKAQGLQVKEFSQPQSQLVCLDYSRVNANSLEQRLSILCYHVLNLYQQQQDFSFILPGFKRDQACSRIHRDECLNALASYAALKEPLAHA